MINFLIEVMVNSLNAVQQKSHTQTDACMRSLAILQIEEFVVFNAFNLLFDATALFQLPTTTYFIFFSPFSFSDIT